MQFQHRSFLPTLSCELSGKSSWNNACTVPLPGDLYKSYDYERVLEPRALSLFGTHTLAGATIMEYVAVVLLVTSLIDLIFIKILLQQSTLL